MSEQTTRRMARPVPPGPDASSASAGALGPVRWVLNLLATLVRIAALLCALVLVGDIVLALVGVDSVNASNPVAQIVGHVSGTLVLAFRDLFLPADPTVAKVVDFGLAAVFWIVVGEVVSRILRRLARAAGRAARRG